MNATIKKQMEQAIEKIAEKLNEKSEEPVVIQETNIFKILKVDNYEIRHGAFLEFLLDPERNPELAYHFLEEWLKAIDKELTLSDGQVNKIIDGEYEDILPIEKADGRYSEIPISKDKNSQRIDHALEVKLEKTRRVFVFEYKFNGRLDNDLKAYKKFVDGLYKGKQAKIYYFCLELGHKKHNVSADGSWQFISRDTLVEAVSNTLAEAKRKDMFATQLYMKYYLEILQPDIDPIKDCRRELWNLWNPEIARCDPEGEHCCKLIEKSDLSNDHKALLYSFHYDLLVEWKVAEWAEQNGMDARINSRGVRLRPRGCCRKHLYLYTYLDENEKGDLFLATKLTNLQDNEVSQHINKKQYQFMRTVLENFEIKHSIKWADPKEKPSLRSVVVVNNDDKKIIEKEHRSNPEKPFDLSFTWLWPLCSENNELEKIAIATEQQQMPDVFSKWTDDIKWWVEKISSS